MHQCGTDYCKIVSAKYVEWIEDLFNPGQQTQRLTPFVYCFCGKCGCYSPIATSENGAIIHWVTDNLVHSNYAGFHDDYEYSQQTVSTRGWNE